MAANTMIKKMREIRRTLSLTPKAAEKIVFEEEPDQQEEHRLQTFEDVFGEEEIDRERLEELSFDGIPEEGYTLKAQCWKVLLNYLPSTRSEWTAHLDTQRTLYAHWVEDLFKVPTSADSDEAKEQESREALSFEAVGSVDDPLSSAKGNVWEDYFKDAALRDEVEKDIKRTHTGLMFFRSELPLNSQSRLYTSRWPATKHSDVMIRLLCVFAKLNQGVRYVQGMNELLSPLYYVFSCDKTDNSVYAEADAFFCFTNLMSELQDRFIAEQDQTQLGILAQLQTFDELLARVDPALCEFLKQQALDSRFFALRWFTLLMTMEFELPDALRLWDSFLSDSRRFIFVRYFAVSMLLSLRGRLLEGTFASNLQLLQHYPGNIDIQGLLYEARELFHQFPSD